MRIDNHIAADESSDGATAAIAGDSKTLSEMLGEQLERIHGSFGRAIAEIVRVAVGKDDDVAGGQVFTRAFGKPGEGASFGEEVIDDEVPTRRVEQLLPFRGRRREETPWGGEFTIEENSALEFDGAEELRKNVHGVDLVS